MRDRAGIFDLSAFAIFDVSGPGALDALQRVSMRQVDVAVGRVVYTPWLSPGGGFKSDLTIMRLGDEHFRVVTGGAHGMADTKWLRDHLPEDGSAQLADLTSAWWTLGLWGPRARDILASVTSDDVSHEGFPVRDLPDDRDRAAPGARVADLVRRRPRLGAVRPDRAGRARSGTSSGRPAARTAPCRPGSASTARPAGSRSATARTAPSSRASTPSSRPGWALPKVKEQDFVGKEAHLAAARGGAGRDSLHAHRRRPHVVVRRCALSAWGASRS